MWKYAILHAFSIGSKTISVIKPFLPTLPDENSFFFFFFFRQGEKPCTKGFAKPGLEGLTFKPLFELVILV